MRKNAKTNNKASHPGGLFYWITTKATSMTEENPLLALRDKISALDE
ncbi:bifunctional chorismate mutase/prephenate dehydratase, partial [Acinetobacter baumannii]|nr:bifunctional chorismate mutase/prephenate dehydratase [Acinetobacter baumannii]